MTTLIHRNNDSTSIGGSSSSEEDAGTSTTPSFMTTRRQRSRRRSTQSPSSPTPVTSISIPPAIFDFVALGWHCVCLCWEVFIQPQLSHMALIRVSVLLISCHHADVWLEQHVQQQQQQVLLSSSSEEDSAYPDAPPYAPLFWYYHYPPSSSSATPPLFPLNTTAWWLGVCVMLTGFLLLLLVVIAASQQPQQAWFAATALISLFCLEALLPLVVLTCAVLWLLQQIHWMTSLCVLGIIWTFITILAHWIRCTLYTSLG